MSRDSEARRILQVNLRRPEQPYDHPPSSYSALRFENLFIICRTINIKRTSFAHYIAASNKIYNLRGNVALTRYKTWFFVRRLEINYIVIIVLESGLSSDAIRESGTRIPSFRKERNTGRFLLLIKVRGFQGQIYTAGTFEIAISRKINQSTDVKNYWTLLWNNCLRSETMGFLF